MRPSLMACGGSASSAKYTTTYSAWDGAGRPTAGTSAHPGGTTTLALAYNDATFTQNDDQQQRGPEGDLQPDLRCERQSRVNFV